MNSFTYTTQPQQIISAPGALNQLPALLAQHHWQRLLLVTIPTMQRNGVVGRLQSLLGDQLVAIYGRTQPHVPQQNVQEVIQLARTYAVDAIVALGGGSPIGLAKALAAALGSRGAEEQGREGRVGGKQLSVSSSQSAVSSGQSPVSQSPNLPVSQSPPPLRSSAPLLPIIAIPTTYAGSEMTPIYGITQTIEGTVRKLTTTDPAVTPRLVLYDPELTLDLPAGMTASSGINALAHCLEALYSITRNPLSTAAALEGIRLITSALPRAVANGRDLDARTTLMTGAHLAAVSVSTVKLALHHGLCHTLGGSAAVAHGIANAIILPHALRFNLDVATAELAAAAGAMGVAGSSTRESAENGIDFIHELIRQLDLPQRLREAAVPYSRLPQLAQLALESSAVQANPLAPAAAQIELLLQSAW